MLEALAMPDVADVREITPQARHQRIPDRGDTEVEQAAAAASALEEEGASRSSAVRRGLPRPLTMPDAAKVAPERHGSERHPNDTGLSVRDVFRASSASKDTIFGRCRPGALATSQSRAWAGLIPPPSHLRHLLT